MNFRDMCASFVEMSESTDFRAHNYRVLVRRRIWPPNVHLLLGAENGGSPVAVVMHDGLGTHESVLKTFGMSLVMNGETVVFGWCPSIEDVMGQDWELMKGR